MSAASLAKSREESLADPRKKALVTTPELWLYGLHSVLLEEHSWGPAAAALSYKAATRYGSILTYT